MKLELDRLAVESFETAVPELPAGTVRGRADIPGGGDLGKIEIVPIVTPRCSNTCDFTCDLTCGTCTPCVTCLVSDCVSLCGTCVPADCIVVA